MIKVVTMDSRAAHVYDADDFALDNGFLVLYKNKKRVALWSPGSWNNIEDVGPQDQAVLEAKIF